MSNTKRKTTCTPGTEMITLRVPHALRQQISEFTAQTGATRSALLVEGVQLAMQRRMEAANGAVGVK